MDAERRYGSTTLACAHRHEAACGLTQPSNVRSWPIVALPKLLVKVRSRPTVAGCVAVKRCRFQARLPLFNPTLHDPEGTSRTSQLGQSAHVPQRRLLPAHPG